MFWDDADGHKCLLEEVLHFNDKKEGLLEEELAGDCVCRSGELEEINA